MSWPTTELGNLVEILGGGTPSKAVSEYWNGNIPWASVKDLKTTELKETEDYITADAIKKSASNLIPAGNIIVPTRMALGKVAINLVDMAINQDLKALIPIDQKKLDKNYLMRFLESQASFLERQGKGATVKGITLDVLRSLAVPLPPIMEQKRIAAILDKADAIRRKRQQTIKLADDFLRSVFLEMFGDPVTNPKGIDVVPMTECFHITTGKLNSNAANDGGIYPFFTCAKEVFYIDDYAFDQEALLLAGNNASADYDVKHYVGKFNAYQRTYVLTLKNNASSYEFYKFALEYQLQNLKRSSKGSNTKYITMEIMARTFLPSVDKKLQDEFIGVYRRVGNIISSNMQSLKKLETGFESLSQKAFSGDL